MKGDGAASIFIPLQEIALLTLVYTLLLPHRYLPIDSNSNH